METGEDDDRYARELAVIVTHHLREAGITDLEVIVHVGSAATAIPRQRRSSPPAVPQHVLTEALVAVGQHIPDYLKNYPYSVDIVDADHVIVTPEHNTIM